MTATDTGIQPEKIWAGKYKTPELLEEAYQNSTREYHKVNEALKEANKKINEFSVPANYIVEQSELNESDLALNKRIAKEAGLTQNQFLGLIKGIEQVNNERLTSREQLWENSKKTHDLKEVELVESFVNSYYPKEVQEAIKSNLHSEDVYKWARDQRQKTLNNQLPGMNNASPPATSHSSFDENELHRLIRAANDNPGDMFLRDQVIEMIEKKNNFLNKNA